MVRVYLVVVGVVGDGVAVEVEVNADEEEVLLSAPFGAQVKQARRDREGLEGREGREGVERGREGRKGWTDGWRVGKWAGR